MKLFPAASSLLLALAPMAGVTGHPFRLLAREQGCDLVFSEMISARGLLYRSRRTAALLYHTDAERPIAFQIFGSQPAAMAEAARRLEEWGADIVDINMGCPTPKIVRHGEGGALMRSPEKCSAIFEAVVRAVTCPVTVKMRKGWDEKSVNAPEIARRAEAAGLQAVTVHGRTVEQGYRGKADWEAIRAVKAAVGIPVIGNGDVITPQDAQAMWDYCRCDGIMIGRAAMGSPWIFRQVRAYLEEGRLIAPPSLPERVETAVRHMYLLGCLKGEHTAVREMRRHAAWYIKGLPGAAGTRQRLVRAESYAEMEDILRDFSRKVCQLKIEREV